MILEVPVSWIKHFYDGQDDKPYLIPDLWYYHSVKCNIASKA